MEGTVTIKLKDFKELEDKASSFESIDKKLRAIFATKLPGMRDTFVGDIPEVRKLIESR
jgi:hypothetical protein